MILDPIPRQQYENLIVDDLHPAKSSPATPDNKRLANLIFQEAQKSMLSNPLIQGMTVGYGVPAVAPEVRAVVVSDQPLGELRINRVVDPKPVDRPVRYPGNKVEWIKQDRNNRMCSLKESKDLADWLEARLGYLPYPRGADELKSKLEAGAPFKEKPTPETKIIVAEEARKMVADMEQKAKSAIQMMAILFRNGQDEAAKTVCMAMAEELK